MRHLVELHGGTAHAESAGHGQGSTFRVVLPAAARESNGVEAFERTSSPVMSGAPVVPNSLEGLTVLFVDDDADTRQLLAEILSQCGAQVRTATSSSKALEVFRLWPPDVLLADIGMPDGDGYALIEQVRALPSESGGMVPAAALTAYASAEDRTRVLASGYQAHIIKPVEPASLSALVAELVGRAVVS